MARRDLESIFDYTAVRWDLTQAVRYTDAIAVACAGLAETLHQGQDCAHIRPVIGAAWSNNT